MPTCAPGSGAASGRVVLAEDDVKLARVLSRALGRLGLATKVAPTGDAALAAMRQDSAVTAAVLDIRIPHPDGIEVCHQIRRDHWHGPIVVISALDTADLRARVRQAGADAFVPKPFPLAQLLATMTGLLTGTGERETRT